MRTIIAGSRNIVDTDIVALAVAQSGFNPSLVISGGARGVDMLGEDWALERGVPIERYPADWNTHGKSAGHIRNRQMAEVCDALIAIWDGQSPGTRNMIETAHALGKQMYVHRVGVTVPPPPVAVPKPPVSVPPPPVAIKPRAVMDIECYIDYFLVKFKRVDQRDVPSEFELYPGSAPLDVATLRSILAAYTIVTFNGNNYDMPMLAAALMGYDCANLKWLSDRIITGNMRPWDIEREYHIAVPPGIDHIDLIEILPGQHGLKMYMAKMHSRKIQDLPIAPDASIAPEQRAVLRAYCGNDLDGTIDALNKFAEQIKLRERLGREYGLDLRSKSDAQIAEAVIKAELGFRVERPVWAVGTHFMYDAPAFIQYHTAPLQNLLAMVKQARFMLGPNAIEMPPELDAAKIKIGTSTYRLGIGGLHSSESAVYHVSDADCVLSDHDVASYYPRIFLNLRLYPPQMGPAFLDVFNNLVEKRLAAKRAGDKVTADSIKITINGTFGKTLSKYGVLSAPKLGIQTTVTGQLSLLMLIEMLEMCGIPVVSANTDGIVIKCPRQLTFLRDQIIRDWEQRTGFETEANEYAALFSRDVNNYIAVKASDRSVKLKGAYAPPVPVGGSWPNPTGQICVEAIIDYLLNGTPLETTIRACHDVKKFVYIRTVKGGGQFIHAPEIEAATTKSGMRQQLVLAGWVEVAKELFTQGNDLIYPLKDAHKIAIGQLRERAGIRRDYLGKVVRWYYAAGSQGLITYVGSGNKVPNTEGCRPLMELPDTLPPDINYDWYVVEAKSLLTDMGVAMI